MDKNGLLIGLLFFFLIVLDQSNAFNSRKLVTTEDPNGSDKANQDIPISSPPPDEKKQNPSPVGSTESKDAPTTNPSNVESKGLNDTKNSENSDDKNLDNKGNNTNQDEKEKVEKETRLKTFATKYCNGNPTCSDQEKTMIACIQDFQKDSKKLTVVVQNEGKKTLKANITSGSSTNDDLQDLNIPDLGTEQVIIKLSGDKSNKVILKTENGTCELQISQITNTPLDTPSKPKDPDNSPTPKNVNGTSDSPEKPKQVENTPNPQKDKNTPNPEKDENTPNPEKDKNTPNPEKDENTPNPKKDENTPNPKKDENTPNPKKDENTPILEKDENTPNAEKVDSPDTSTKDKIDVSPKPTTTETNVSSNNFLDQLTFYSKQVTPIYGAYLAFLVALVIGGSWALCTFRKRRSNGGVAYQELEMGLPESSNAVDLDLEPTEGWDQDWDDDDWDEDKAIRSPGGANKSISSNGLTSRGTKKDEWDANWDD